MFSLPFELIINTLIKQGERYNKTNYNNTKEEYSVYGIDTERGIYRLSKIAISIHCWQGDDVGGFEIPNVNLHSSYGEFGDTLVESNKIIPSHFDDWIDWVKKLGIGIDFNGTFFSHPLANDGYSLVSKNEEIRNFWIEHEKRCRKIANYIAENPISTCILDTWIPDGAKNLTVDKIGYRRILKDSLDECFKAKYPKENMRDAVEKNR